MKALIAAGGHATRFRPITWSINKHLLPLAGKPMIFYPIENVVEAGVKEIAININPGDKEIQEVVGDGSRWGVKITYIEQVGGACGIAHAVYNARDWLGEDEPFIFHLGDNIFRAGIKNIVERFHKDCLHCALTLSRAPNLTELGVAAFDANGKLTRVVEKPKDPPSDLAVTGVYVYDKNFFEAFRHIQPSARGEYEISDIHTWLIENGFKVGYDIVDGWWKDPGRPAQLLEGNILAMNTLPQSSYVIEGEVDKAAQIHGLVKIEKGAKIGPNVLIRGPVVIGENAEINNAFIGPFTTIGTGCVVDGAEIEHSVILDKSTIKNVGRIDGSMIGRNVTVAAKTCSLPSSGHKMFVGDNSLVEL
ncbi:MAG: Glucose-1-phosphate thymidyltransferase [Candidatus Uhrbacteria bacterium GW2011_GWE2_45_35]|uniref:Glucose-1-phosphate thymidyltransferase n=2 Tax=Candidatus Uhriibacteriota TaxID=1752732 RepID=A0A0G1MAE7_9BACT|nr:MAG: Glucose-1-phosphate thymidyltransferase [Candidatus Uhrbacteria bacterium GW2011_GWF2_44_350]KKU06446.1 MAG: Glucose-1-phosphate thymidyltransferase [Candidatus Uhrbacteria bacterium GW2011_GWE2_45_35]HBR80120.1 glucose-1-phosphate thymidylyltransferase [Candidatus Uhrbacteria bacterium]HCU31474.1 glucose-1-phosphate thymidylyltransferase [Candidatus Uhrbacteria bacterium]